MADKKVTCRVVSNYGGHVPGQTIAVDEKEYHRLRVKGDEGEYRFPVLISIEDAEAQAKKEQAARDAQLKQAIAEAEHGSAWSKLEEQALSILKARHAEREAAARAEQDRLVAEHKAAKR